MTTYGPHKPHPLARMRTELVWEGKYDEYGNRREVDAAGLAMPLQKIETIDEPRSRAEAQGSLFDEQKAHRDDFRNRLIWGDNKIVAASLLEDFKGAISLIYIDPPFDVDADFRMNVHIGEEGDDLYKDQSLLELVAFRDTWGKGANSYLHMLYERLSIVKDLLSETGSLYVHIGWGVSHFVKAVLDDVFGGNNFLNQIIWKRQSAHSDTKQGASHYGRIHDVILVYTKSDRYNFFTQYGAYSDKYKTKFYRHVEPDTGRRYRLSDITAPGGKSKGNPYYEFLGVTRYWRFSKEKIQELYDAGIVVQTKPGNVPAQKRYLDEMPGVPLQDLWDDIATVQPQSAERLGYDTQKPEALLERIISVSTEEDDIVADLFCGSGTTLAAAERLGRRWLGADIGRFSIHTSRKRLIGLQRELNDKREPYRSFDVYNLGRYERQWWQRDALKGAEEDTARSSSNSSVPRC